MYVMATSTYGHGKGHRGVVVFMWGANSYGQLGLGHKEDTLLPTETPRCFSISKLKQVTGGGGHTLIVTDDGRVHACGWNKNGQIGLFQDSLDITNLEPLRGLTQKITKVSCGWNHSLAITECGQVCVWGSNAYGQLGIPTVPKQVDSPVILPHDAFAGSLVIDISTGLRHSIALAENACFVLEDSKVYTWGDCRKGQLGHGKNNLSTQHSPKCVESLLSMRCKSVAAGVYHSAVIREDGEIMLWGLNQHGQCGLGERTEAISHDLVKLSDTNWILNVYEPMTVQGLPPVSDIHCGWSHTVVISVDREVFTWGRSDYGQLGYKYESDGSISRPGSCCHIPKEIPQLRGVKQVACGSEHTIALMADNSVVTFGWNEHGMCGTGDEVNVHTPHTVKIDRQYEPFLVGAGAGHSMVALCSLA